MRIPFFILTMLAIASCAVSPLGRKQLMLVPDSQMEQLGAQAFQEIKSKTPIEKDAATETFVRCVATDILKKVEGTNAADWEIKVFHEPKTVNAFALPGKKIGIYTGILGPAKTADQLAAVIGHEVGHVIAKHGQERVSQSLAVEVGMSVADVLTRGSSTKRNLVLGALGLGAQFGVLLPFSRVQETEADMIGQRLMATAGFDPAEAVALWKNIEAESGSGQGSEFFSTHPSHERRMENLTRALPEATALYKTHSICKR
jgi:predicted Zn-dependent protease